MNTVIKKNNTNYDPDAETLSKFDTRDMKSDYDSMSDYNPMPNPDMSKEHLDATSQAVAGAFQQVYGTPLDASAPKADDITSIQPNIEYKDENGDSICGAPTL